MQMSTPSSGVELRLCGWWSATRGRGEANRAGERARPLEEGGYRAPREPADRVWVGGSAGRAFLAFSGPRALSEQSEC